MTACSAALDVWRLALTKILLEVRAVVRHSAEAQWTWIDFHSPFNKWVVCSKGKKNAADIIDNVPSLKSSYNTNLVSLGPR